MKNSEYLFHLINSLSKSEKRFFTLASKFQSGDKIYFKVFSAIEKMQEYDEDVLLKKMGWNKLPDAERKRKLSVNKNYLYNQILKSLRSYNEKESVNVQLYNLILDVETLRAKSLFLPAVKRLAQAKKIALDHEKLLVLLDILSLEIGLSMSIRDRKVKSTVDRLYTETNEVLSQLQQLLPIQQLHSEAFVIIRTRTKEAEAEFAQRIEMLLPAEEFAPTLKSFYTTSYYYHTLASYYRNRSPKKAYEYRLKIIELWRSRPKIKNTQLTRYTIILSNYLQSCHGLEKYEEFPEILKEISALPIRSQEQELEIFQNVHFLELLYYINTDKFHEAQKLIPVIEKGFKKHKINKAREITFYFNITILFFALVDYKKAWKWLDKILYGDKSDVKKNIQEFSGILEVVIHLEQNSDQVVNHLFSTARALKNVKSNSLKALAFKHLKKIAKTPTMRKGLYQTFRADLTKLKPEENYFGLDILSIWVETKITNKPFIEILRERNKKRQIESTSIQ